MSTELNTRTTHSLSLTYYAHSHQTVYVKQNDSCQWKYDWMHTLNVQIPCVRRQSTQMKQPAGLTRPIQFKKNQVRMCTLHKTHSVHFL